MILQQFNVDKKTNCNHDTKYTQTNKELECTSESELQKRSVISHLLSEDGSGFLMSFETCSVITLQLITLMWWIRCPGFGGVALFSVFCVVFLKYYCFVCLRSVSCSPNVASVNGLFLHCPSFFSNVVLHLNPSNVLYNNAAHIVTCVDCHFTNTWKTLTLPYHFSKEDVWAHKTSLTNPHLLLKCLRKASKVSGHVFVC